MVGLPGRCHVGDPRVPPAEPVTTVESWSREPGQRMDTPDEHAATAPRDLLRERVRRRPEPSQWTHQVADRNSGQVHSAVLGEPPASKSRVEGLSRLGSVADTTIFG
jgi:hypothetical protein